MTLNFQSRSIVRLETALLAVALLAFGEARGESAASDLRSGERFEIEVDGVEYKFCPIQAGTFTMGSPENEAGRNSNETLHEEKVSEFWILESEVTVGMWRSFVKESGRGAASKTESASVSDKKNDPKSKLSWDDPGYQQTDEFPATFVNFNDALDFCDWFGQKVGLTCALPDESEWEYACRAGSTAPYPGFSDSDPESTPLSDYCRYLANSADSPHSVKSLNPNEWGVYDMLGNVAEWCLDGDEQGRSVRGGSWADTKENCRAACRLAAAPDSREPDLGFRVVLKKGSSANSAFRDDPDDATGETTNNGSFLTPLLKFAAIAGAALVVCALLRLLFLRFLKKVKRILGGGSGSQSAKRVDGKSGRNDPRRESKDRAPSAETFNDRYAHAAAPEDRYARATAPEDRYARATAPEDRYARATAPEDRYASARRDEDRGGPTDFEPGEIVDLPLSDDVLLSFHWCPPGQFVMGSASPNVKRAAPDETPRLVRITRGFWLAETTVTKKQWELVMGDEYRNFDDYLSRSVRGAKFPPTDDLDPVRYLSWNDCRTFLRKLNEDYFSQDEASEPSEYRFRLPTEAEWEYACRAEPSDRVGWPRYGGANDVAWYSCDRPRRVGDPLKAPNRWGLRDMLGNLWEWCLDAYEEDLSLAADVDPIVKGGRTAERVLRGGAFDCDAERCRAAARWRMTPSRRDARVGLRLVLCRYDDPFLEE